jgi:thioredoxin 1
MNLLTVLVFVVATCSLAQDDVPPIFATLGFDKALDQNKTDRKLLIVKATATWCAPCKQMDRTTWRDEKVVQWFESNGVAVHFDVDKEKPLAQKLDIQAMPTMIAFKDGAEFDRIVGYKDATDFLSWLEGLRAGKKSIEAVRARAVTAPKGTESEIKARYELATELQRKGDLDQATEEYVWLWQHAAGTSYSGVRGSFMAGQIQELAARHSPAKQRFVRFRDELTKLIEGETVARNDFDDWIVLNQIVGEDKRTLEWFDQKQSDARWLPLFRSAAFRIDQMLVPAGRWKDLALLHPDPVAEIQRRADLNAFGASFRNANKQKMGGIDLDELDRGGLRSEAGRMYAAHLAAEDTELARAVVDKIVEIDDSAATRLDLVQWALSAEQPRADQAALLDAAEKKSADPKKLARLREKLKKALAPTEAK